MMGSELHGCPWSGVDSRVDSRYVFCVFLYTVTNEDISLKLSWTREHSTFLVTQGTCCQLTNLARSDREHFNTSHTVLPENWIVVVGYVIEAPPMVVTKLRWPGIFLLD
jgi:hypothetical protein